MLYGLISRANIRRASDVQDAMRRGAESGVAVPELENTGQCGTVPTCVGIVAIVMSSQLSRPNQADAHVGAPPSASVMLSEPSCMAMRRSVKVLC